MLFNPELSRLALLVTDDHGQSLGDFDVKDLPQNAGVKEPALEV